MAIEIEVLLGKKKHVDEMQLRGIASDCMRLLLPKDEPEEVQRDLDEKDEEDEEENTRNCWVKRLTTRVSFLFFFFFTLR